MRRLSLRFSRFAVLGTCWAVFACSPPNKTGKQDQSGDVHDAQIALNAPTPAEETKAGSPDAGDNAPRNSMPENAEADRAFIQKIDMELNSDLNYVRTLGVTPLAQYELYKAVARRVYAGPGLELNSHILQDSTFEGRLLEPAHFDVINCSRPSFEEDSSPPKPYDSLRDTALTFVQMEQDLTKAGYNPTIYRDALKLYEKRMLQAVADSSRGTGLGVSDFVFERALQTDTEARRISKEPTSMPIVADGGCGDGESDVEFRLSPSNGIAQIIRVFSFEVCRAEEIDPWDADRCRSWRIVRNGRSLPVSGTYRYLARWPDGRSDRGTFETQAFAKDGEQLPIEFSSPDP